MPETETLRIGEPRGSTPRGTAESAPPPAGAHGAAIGRYLVMGRLGEGAVGAVYAAYDPELDRRVAIKLLRTAWASDSARARLVREARALAKLSSPHVVQVHDAGVHEGNVFIAMELVEGQSLKDWQKTEPRPSTPAIIRAYVDAARGLAAAHARGLVHRDVKPANILRGDDGRVRVADFGLVAHDAPEPRDDAPEPDRRAVPARAPIGLSPSSSPVSASPPPSSLRDQPDAKLTSTGALMGTPAYMAPEQYTNAAVGPAADQYSLCVALYEALYGALPFALDPSEEGLPTVVQIMQKKLAGDLLPPPATSAVPAWIYPVLRRGLATRPEDRYPSLAALSAALSDDPVARRSARLRTLGAALGAALLGAVAIAGWARSGAFQDPCGGAASELSGVWDEPVKRKLTAAFLATGRAYAPDTAARVSALFDQYAAAWTRMRAEVCRAQQKQKRPAGGDLLELREQCLGRRRGQLRALTEVLAREPDPTALDTAVQAANRLYPVAYCADEKALTARVAPPEDPALRARVEALIPRLDQIEALDKAGKYKEALAGAEALAGETADLAYAPLRAQVLYRLGSEREKTSAYEGATTALREAVTLAARGKDDVLAANAWGALLLVVGHRRERFAEAQALIDWGPPVMERTDDERVQGTWFGNLGLVLWRMGRYEDALAQQERALAIRQKVLGPDHPDVALSMSDVSVTLWSMGRYEEALAQQERALAIRQKVLGPDHPAVSGSLNNLGIYLWKMGRYEQALAEYERALAIRQKALGPDDLSVAQVLQNMGALFGSTGRHEQALPCFERALAIRQKALGPGNPAVADSLDNLGVALSSMGRDEQALPSFERALAIQQKALGPDHPELGVTLENLGELSGRMGRYEQSLRYWEQALAVRQKTLGPDHPELANALTGVGRALVRLRRQLDTAARDLARALALREKTLGKSHHDLAHTLLGLGELALARGRPAEALPLLERALKLDNADAKHDIELTLAEALFRLHRDKPRALALAQQARDEAARVGHKPHQEQAERWLAKHR